MFEAEYLIFCESKTVDDRERLTLGQVFETVYATKFPASHSNFQVVFKLRALTPVIDKDIKVILTLTLGKEQIGNIEAEFHVTVEKDNAIIPSFDLGQAVFPKAGKYTLKLYVAGKPVIDRLLFVKAVSDLSEA